MSGKTSRVETVKEEDMQVGKQRLREAVKGYSYGWSQGCAGRMGEQRLRPRVEHVPERVGLRDCPSLGL